MSFFKRLFGGKPKQDNPQRVAKSSKDAKEKKEENQPFHTNAPEHGFDVEVKNTGLLRIDAILAISYFGEVCKERGLDFSYEVLYTNLLEEGALTIPMVFKAGDKGYSVFFIYEPGEAGMYADAIRKIGETEYPNAIYYSVVPDPASASPIISTASFQTKTLRQLKEPQLKGQFSMWWASEEDKSFGTSTTRAALDRIYKAVHRYETVYCGYLLLQLGIEKEMSRVNLPDDHSLLAVHGPESVTVLIDFSLEKGIRFMFPVDDCRPGYRERFLEGVAAEFEDLRQGLESKPVDQDPLTDPNGYDWYTFMSSVTAKKEAEGEGVDFVGLIQYD